jgi:hypothetical protein
LDLQMDVFFQMNIIVLKMKVENIYRGHKLNTLI